MVVLDKRLRAVADLVRKNSVFADIGTDHAYIPVFLISKNICKFGYASDLRKGPLASARRNSEIYGVSDKTEMFLSDGLAEYKEKKVDDFIIAGMGGELIANIINEAPFEITQDMKFILQPMSREEDLREYLACSGFRIISEQSVSDKDKSYIIIYAEKGQENGADKDIYKYIGKLDPCSEDTKKYIRKKIKSLYKKINGLTQAGKASEADEYITAIEKLRKEINEN